MEPPLILISLATKAASTQAIINNDRFSVSVLAEDQVEVAKTGAKPGVPKFFEDFVETEDGFNHNVKNALASIHCKVEQTIEAGDHTIFIGLVEDVILGQSKSPLLHYNRQFGVFNTSVKS